MLAYTLRRLWQFIPTLGGVVLLVFFVFNFVGGDPAYLLAGKIPNPETIANIRRQLGVDEPYAVQLWIFVRQALTGDFGASWSTNERVSEIFATRLGPSLTVLVPLLAISTVLGMAAAMLVAYVRGSITDRGLMIACTVGQSISILVYILVFQYVFAYHLGWFPVQGWGVTFMDNLLRYAVLAIIVGVAVSLAPDIRLYRTFFLDEINQDYVRTARAKGLSERRVMWVHVLRNAAIPITTVTGITIASLIALSAVVERAFSLNGLGSALVNAAASKDFAVVQGISLVLVGAFVITNAVVDLLYAALDPRVALGSRAE